VGGPSGVSISRATGVVSRLPQFRSCWMFLVNGNVPCGYDGRRPILQISIGTAALFSKLLTRISTGGPRRSKVR